MFKTQFLKSYQKFLVTNSNPERAQKEKAYLYSNLKHYGLPFGKREYFLKEHRSKIIKLNKSQVWTLAKALWQKASFEERIMATDILVLLSIKLNESDLPKIEKLIRECRGWALLDNFVIPIMPQLLTKYPKTYEWLKKWIKDPDYWMRRSALLSQLLLFRQGQGGNEKLFFQMAKAQFSEGWIDKLYQNKLENKRAKFFIRKAIGWSLREMSQKNPAVVFEFLKENKQQMSGLSFREGSRKLPETLRQQLL